MRRTVVRGWRDATRRLCNPQAISMIRSSNFVFQNRVGYSFKMSYDNIGQHLLFNFADWFYSLWVLPLFRIMSSNRIDLASVVNCDVMDSVIWVRGAQLSSRKQLQLWITNLANLTSLLEVSCLYLRQLIRLLHCLSTGKAQLIVHENIQLLILHQSNIQSYLLFL